MHVKRGVWNVSCCTAYLLALAAVGVAQTTVEQGSPAPQGKLRLATCQFPVCGDIATNADWIRRQIREAHDRDADLVHFPECA